MLLIRMQSFFGLFVLFFQSTGTCTYKRLSTYKFTQMNFAEYFEKHASIYSQEVICRYLKDILLHPNDNI